MRVAYIAVCALVLFIWATLIGCSQKSNESEKSFDYQILCAAKKKDSCQWPDEELKNKFTQYWGLRYKGPTDKVFALEAPYFQYAVPKGRYKNYVRPGFQLEIDRVDIYRIRFVGNELITLSIKVRHRKPSGQLKTVNHKDWWLRINGRWHHVLKNAFIFPELS